MPGLLQMKCIYMNIIDRNRRIYKSQKHLFKKIISENTGNIDDKKIRNSKATTKHLRL